MRGQSTPLEQVDLDHLNTLNVSARARYYLEVHNADELREAMVWAQHRELEILVLGGGSNLVFAGDFHGLVVRICIRGRSWHDVRGQEAVLTLGAGENWHEAVLYSARSGYRGIENLALIPGTAGAAPVQNIGAYGMELCDTLDSLTALDRQSGQMVRLGNDECRFGYRDSLFKQVPGRYVITEIRLRLSRQRPLQLGYRDLEEYLGDITRADLGPVEVAEAVMAIRRRKLPDPAVIPNAGSFFKNPVVSVERFAALQERFPGIVGHHQVQGVKLAAAWLIDQSGWKGFREPSVGVHNRQALVLVNHSKGTGQQVLALAERIRASVRDGFGVDLEIEPGIIGAE